MSSGGLDPEDERLLEKMRRRMVEEDYRKQTTPLTGVNCFVCYLDLDGFREKIGTAPHDLFETYQQQRQYILASFFQANASGSNSGVTLHHFDKMLWPYLFSDSWFFSTIDSSQQALQQISTVAAGVFMRCWEIGFPAHGAIAEGPLWWRPDLQIILGPGLVKAYLAAESMDSFGVAVHSDLAEKGSGAFTPTHRVLQRRRRLGLFPTHQDTRFCRLYAYKTNTTWGTESYLARYDKMAAEYAARPNAKASVKRRYRRSRPIVEAMLK